MNVTMGAKRAAARYMAAARGRTSFTDDGAKESGNGNGSATPGATQVAVSFDPMAGTAFVSTVRRLRSLRGGGMVDGIGAGSHILYRRRDL